MVRNYRPWSHLAPPAPAAATSSSRTRPGGVEGTAAVSGAVSVVFSCGQGAAHGELANRRKRVHACKSVGSAHSPILGPQLLQRRQRRCRRGRRGRRRGRIRAAPHAIDKCVWHHSATPPRDILSHSSQWAGGGAERGKLCWFGASAGGRRQRGRGTCEARQPPRAPCFVVGKTRRMRSHELVLVCPYATASPPPPTPVFVCVYICMCACVHQNQYAGNVFRIRTHGVSACVSTHTRTHTHTHTHTHKHTHAHTRTRTHTHTQYAMPAVRVRVSAHGCVCTNVHAHAHKSHHAGGLSPKPCFRCARLAGTRAASGGVAANRPAPSPSERELRLPLPALPRACGAVACTSKSAARSPG